MTWLDQLQPASFRNVPFQVDTIEVTAGDNTVLREYPFQDLPTVFRMGEGVEEIKFSAYVIGDDYLEQREQLREVLTGEGVLVHPTAGSIRVYVVGKYSIKENPTAEGGMARFDLSFVRAEARRYPVGVANTESQAVEAAAGVKESAADQFAETFDILKAPGWVADRAMANLTASLDGVWGQVKGVTAGLSDFTNGAIANYQTLRSNLDDLVRTPRLLADAIGNLFSLPTELSAAMVRDFQSAFSWAFDMDKKIVQTDFEVSVMPAVGAGLVMFGAGNAEALGLDSAARQQLTQLKAATDQLFESMATAGFVEAVAAVEMEGYDEAIKLRQTINDQCTRLLLEASAQRAPAGLTASSWYGAMQALHTAALADLQARSRNLTRLTIYTPQAWESVWLISYKIFGTAAYADEILVMNPHIEHPLLAPPGKPLRLVRHD